MKVLKISIIYFILIILFSISIKSLSFAENKNNLKDNITANNKNEEDNKKYLDLKDKENSSDEDFFIDIYNSDDTDSSDDLYIIDEINVIENVGIGKDPGVTDIPREVIRSLPSGNQGITDILKAAPGVRVGENYRGANNAGEIKPGDISISGANPYDNLYLVDGMSNSSILDPGSNDPFLENDVPGNAQKFFLTKWLLEDITLLDSDISAKYDGFQGGVVNVKTRKPSQKFKGSFDYRGTNNYLTSYHISKDIKKDYKNSSQENQLHFDKHFLSASLDIPMGNKGGLMLSYNRNWSNIPFFQLDTLKNQKRINESYYTKGLIQINSESYTDFFLSYSPHYESYFINNAINSDFEIEGGGIFTGGNYVNEINGHKIVAHLDYTYSINKRTAHNEFKEWAYTDDKNWGGNSNYAGGVGTRAVSLEGGYGSILKEEHSVKGTFDHDIKPIDLFGLLNLSYGLSLAYNHGSYNRGDYAYKYSNPIIRPDLICINPNDNTCSESDQFFSKRYVTPSSDVSAGILNFDTYFEGKYKIERFDFRLGGRLSIDNYMNNLNFALRARLSIDLFNNEQTILSGGYNRYYAASMLTYKLREGRAPSYFEKRSSSKNEVKDVWLRSQDYVPNTYKFSHLKTPYNDEYTASINQKFLESYINLKYLERHGKDGIASNPGNRVDESGVTYYSFNNSGTSFYRSVILKWQKSWKNHNLMFNVTWSQSETSNNSYDTVIDVEEFDNEIVLNGNLDKVYNLPKDNFARPVVANLTYVGKFFDRLKISLNLNYESPYKNIEYVGVVELKNKSVYNPDTKETKPKIVPSYETIEHGHNATVDMGIYWEQPLYKTSKLTLFCEIYNLLNTKNLIGKRLYSGTDADSYELGLQLWFGANLEF